ncbi:MAG: hypothetical protein EXQ53_02080 [Acidobacteria bacterium]|nr:hypothetical protein [Acidobacteriota bacterium]
MPRAVLLTQASSSSRRRAISARPRTVRRSTAASRAPATLPGSSRVGAASHEGTPARSNDTLARFSSRGPTWIDFAAKPDLVAPGVGTESLSDPHSALYSTYADYLLDGTRSTPYKPYLSLTGTSKAAPVVAATVALMLEANPDLTPNAVKTILQYTAEVREGESFLAQGAGLLNALGAVRMATFFGAPKKGMPVPDDTIENEPIERSRHIIWGNDRIDGGFPLPGSNAWALGVTWGADATKAGRPIVWGVKADDNIVWSTRGNDNIVWSTDCGGADCEGVVWGARGDGDFVWGTAAQSDNIVWSTRGDDNIVWSTGDVDQILWPAAQPVDNRRPLKDDHENPSHDHLAARFREVRAVIQGKGFTSRCRVRFAAPGLRLVLLDLLGVSFEQVRQRGAGRRRQHPRLDVREQLLARVYDVQVSHRELADAILRRKHRRALLHRQPLGLVSQIRAPRIEDRVIVAPPQLDHNFAGNRPRHPPLR